MVKYRVKAKVKHLLVDGKRLGPGDTFEQTEEFYERNKIFVDPVYPERKLSEAVDKPTKVEEDDETSKPQGSRVVRPSTKEDKKKN
jgi:hypothetical protein